MQGQGSGHLQQGGSYVTLTDGSDFTIVVEKMSWAHSQWCDLRRIVDSLTRCSIRPPVDEFKTLTETATFYLQGPWAQTQLVYVWRTVFGWDGMIQTNSTFFEQLQPIHIQGGQFTLTINPDELFTVTTLSTGSKAPIPTPAPSQPFPATYADNFDHYNVSSEAQYFADQAGAFKHL